MKTAKFKRYGALWSDDDAIEIEKSCIAKGGHWRDDNGTLCGKGLFHHYKELWKIWWPEDDEHRWADLILKHYLENQYLTVMGAASSSKTYTVAKIGLTDYACFPDETLTLVSSTDVRGLELRVWGAIKSLWERAFEHDEHFPGTVIDYLHAVTTQQAGSGMIRDLRSGLICIPCLSDRGQFKGLGRYAGCKNDRVRLFADECFPAGTLVDTSDGPLPIESISPGHYVRNCVGLSRVLVTRHSYAYQLVRIHFKGKSETIDCTPNHKLLTNMGWVNAIDLTAEHAVITSDEAVQIMRKGVKRGLPLQSTLLLSSLPDGWSPQEMPLVSQTISPQRQKSDFLYSVLRSTLEDVPAGHCGENDCQQGLGGKRTRFESVHHGESEGANAAFTIDAAAKSSNRSGTSPAQRIALWRSRFIPYAESTGNDSARPVSKSTVQSPNSYRTQRQLESRAAYVLVGYGMARYKIGCRSRWIIPPESSAIEKGQSSRHFPERAWVDHVEILESTGDPRYDCGAKGYPVYNLQVEGHHSYSVNGLVVKNCQFMQPSFLGAIANLRNNPDFKAVFLGNPLGLSDPLDIVAEPECGWHKHPIPEKTSVWKTRKFRGVCVNLIGTDSPNFDHPGEIRFPYLTRPDTIEDTLRDYGPNSAEFWSQCKGARITGLIARKVITADLCKQHGAERDPEWLGKMRTRIYAIDAAYGNVGGDRCVAGHIEFGPDPEGNLILYVPRYKLVPIEIGNGVTPEDQIATWVRDDCIALDIPPENVFHDATGRGSLGTSFGRIWSPKVNPVEFGGSASSRPVTNDTFIMDPRTGEKRLLLCYEKYANFVTELWYSVRYTIEAGQMRGLPPDVMEEGCLREWMECRGNKIQVEPKKDMKERVGRSPDLFDWLSTAIEGARRHGFQISRMIGVFESDPDNFLAKEEEKTQNLIANQQLTFS